MLILQSLTKVAYPQNMPVSAYRVSVPQETSQAMCRVREELMEFKELMVVEHLWLSQVRESLKVMVLYITTVLYNVDL